KAVIQFQAQLHDFTDIVFIVDAKNVAWIVHDAALRARSSPPRARTSITIWAISDSAIRDFTRTAVAPRVLAGSISCADRMMTGGGLMRPPNCPIKVRPDPSGIPTSKMTASKFLD